MATPDQLLARLDAIGDSLKQTVDALALLGLGSVGTETDRLDTYSDLDFFVIVKTGLKNRFIASLDWLEAVHPLTYYFQNTDDGYKALYEDGIFCEFAIFEPHELKNIPFANGRIVWQAADFDGTTFMPQRQERKDRPVEWMLGEALTNLYVGLGRYHRGEILSATRLIQNHAVDRIVELTKHLETSQTIHEDPFNSDRRYESRYPRTALQLKQFIQGYDHNIESALAILGFLEAHFVVNPAVSNAIRHLCQAK